MASTKGERYLHWLISELNVRNNYHHHKENMAWVITALFVPGIITLGFVLKDAGQTSCYIVLVQIVFAALVCAFVIRQFQLRSGAADTIAAIINIVNELCIDHKAYIDSLKLEALKVKKPYNANKPWPIFIENEIAEAKHKGRTLSTMICTDVASIAAIIIATALSICLAYPTT